MDINNLHVVKKLANDHSMLVKARAYLLLTANEGADGDIIDLEFAPIQFLNKQDKVLDTNRLSAGTNIELRNALLTAIDDVIASIESELIRL